LRNRTPGSTDPHRRPGPAEPREGWERDKPQNRVGSHAGVTVLSEEDLGGICGQSQNYLLPEAQRASRVRMERLPEASTH
jgi:hypothetical protein